MIPKSIENPKRESTKTVADLLKKYCVDIFDGKLDIVKLIVYIINLINMNGGYVQES